MKKTNKGNRGGRVTLEVITQARAKIETIYLPSELVDIGLDIEALLTVKSINEVLAEIRSLGIDPTIETSEVERLVARQLEPELPELEVSGEHSSVTRPFSFFGDTFVV